MSRQRGFQGEGLTMNIGRRRRPWRGLSPPPSRPVTPRHGSGHRAFFFCGARLFFPLKNKLFCDVFTGSFPDLDDNVLPGLKRLILDTNNISGRR